MTHRPRHVDPTRSRRLLARLCGAGSVAALLLGAGHAHAQGDLKPVPPNILLLVDTSGSMDYKTSSDQFPTCRYSGTTDTGQPSERSRWIDVVEVLTGSISSYQCQRLDRNSSQFRSEFALGGSPPYDALYANPYHRPASDKCVTGPGTLDASNAAAFPPGAIKYHPFDNTAASCAFQQTADGVLDSFVDQIRFGLMTFDTDPNPSTQVSGLWSYYVDSSSKGQPVGCDPQDQEVGVRNASAPPWEGRAVGFGDPSPGSGDYQSRNAMIQQILVATRPYGATPIAGMLDDARAFLLRDTSTDPLNFGIKFGPQGDVAVTGANACRKQAIILLSDGQPNLDLRPFCEPAGCPYDKAEDIAEKLKQQNIEIYVIGFALPKVVVGGVERTCESFADSDFDSANPTGICAQNQNNAAIQACCSLNRIAAAGGHVPGPSEDEDWRRAHFADNRDELRYALQKAIGASLGATTRIPAVPVAGPGFITGLSDTDFATGFRFGASVNPNSLKTAWTGDLTRQRFQCTDDDGDGVKVPELQEVSVAEGDNFVANVNSAGPNARTLFTVLGTAPAKSDKTMRPNLPGSVNDGAGSYSGTLGKYDATSLVAAVTPEAIKVDDGTCDSASAGVDLNKTQCRDRYLQWWVGLNNGTPFQRCSHKNGPDDCALVGDFLHAVPRPVPGRPNELLNDASYDKFRAAQVTAKRPAVLYAASNDGFLHAFKIAQVDKDDSSETMKVKSKESNELWAFVPPAVLPGVPSLYPGTHQQLLDGHPVVKDVVATEDSALVGYKFRLQRSQADAAQGNGTWRTILLQSFGRQRPGYYALDVTDPVPVGSGGPKFLWQLVSDENGDPLFGTGGGTPLITTVFLGGVEVAVAVLPGGYASTSGAGACPRKTTDFSLFTTHASAYKPRTEVPCYSAADQKLARSLTVVRLDSGEILRTFRQDAAEVPTLQAKGLVTEAPLDSPLTGQPVPFPSEAGAVADRVFIGDQDGALWRLNLATDTGSAADWKVELFFDGFPSSGSFGHGASSGQPVETPPIISVNDLGALTIAFSTGKQEVVGGAAKLVNYVWSLTESNSDRTKLLPAVNWYKSFTDADQGERVIGSMALFNRFLYFSTMGVPAENSCDTGTGAIWAMHYVTPSADGAGSGGLVDGAFLKKLTGVAGSKFAELEKFTDGPAALSGATVAQEPTCRNPGPPEDDAYFSNGDHNPLGNATGGGFQLLIPIGQGSRAADLDANLVTLGRASAVAVDIESPAVLTRVDSWAAIVE